ncbi:prickle-like protein 4 isoform X2 [Nannospalax galili]|uniref:prickle-like protein 4 isoform X2 n=1 Tax=Nannospalax galili TaxID=1026970 RepID=UPI00111C5441|nr:prickle-like protein 4 isoform X2 [Nannospalax galili]XP_029414588.1 prickle-like protein 4 isoform X2 [Nannospalax galili]
MLMQKSGWPGQQDSSISGESGPPVNSDSNSGHWLSKDNEDASVQVPADLILSLPHVDTNQASSWPGLQTLLQQLPPQDSDERYCLALGEEELAELRLFCAQRQQKSLGQGVARLLPPKLEGQTCEKCKERLKPGEYGVFAARAGERCCWHRPCFACQACGQALIYLIYFYHDGHLYCGRHHAELLRPRCPACDQLIFSQRCTEAEGRRWHENHFCCQDCAGPLGGGRYALPGGIPCCPNCFESRYRNAGPTLAGALEGRASLGKGGEGVDLKGAGGLGWAEEWGISRARTLTPAPRLSTPPSSALSSHRNPQTQAWGPAALTASPRSERSTGFPNPPCSAVGAATRDSLRGEGGPDLSEGWDGATSEAEAVSRAVLSAAVASSNQETPSGPAKGRDQDCLETLSDPDGEDPCPTCSSSSESEPEGFFFGQRLPGPWKTPGNLHADDSDTSRRHCTIC